MRRLVGLVIIAAFSSWVGGSGHPSAEAAHPTATIRAEILGKISRSPSAASPEAAAIGDIGINEIAVQGATIEVKGLAGAQSTPLKAVTQSAGLAEIRDIPVSADARNPTRVDIVVSAPGYASFTYLSVPLYPNGGPILTPVLKDVPQTDNVAAARPPAGESETADLGDAAGTLAITSCTGYTSTNTPPNVIKVYHNNPDHAADYQVHTVDFVEYAQHVLPHEWSAGWHTEALRAGAMAVKMFGWYHVLHSNSTGAGCYDVDSTTNYQVWDPNIEYPQTNTAVLDTWDYYLTRSDGTPYQTFYKSGYPGDACGQWFGGPAPGNDMSQNGSEACAAGGRVWYDILLNLYYFNPQSSLVHGPHAVGSTVENLPLLIPLIAPRSGSSGNTQARISWTGQSGVQYYLCTASGSGGSPAGFFSTFPSCSLIGTGSSYKNVTVPTTEQAIRYYRIVACQNGYCSATRGGGLEYRSVSGNWFYATVGYNWVYGTAYVTTRNLSWTTVNDSLYDGVYGYGGVLKKSCATAPGTNCGPHSWIPGSASYWYASGCQTNPTIACAAIRVIPKKDHVGGE